MSPDLHHLTGAYSVDALDDAEHVAFEQHLVGCAACRAEVSELTDAAHTLAVLAEATPPAALRESVLAGIARVRPLPPLVGGADETPAPEVVASPAPVAGEPAAVAGIARVIPLFRRPAAWVATAAAAAVIAVGGAVWSPWSAGPPSLTAVQQVEQARDAATMTSHKGSLTATLAYSRDLDRSALTVAGMPPVAKGSVYQLWYIGNGMVRSAGFLTAGSDGRGEAVLAGSLEGAEQVGVTVEPAGGSRAPTTQPIMVMALA